MPLESIHRQMPMKVAVDNRAGTTMGIEDINALITADKRKVDTLIRQRLHSDVVLVNQVAHYIISSGGKRLRPLLVLLGAKVFGYEGNYHLQLAAVVEFIHTATLLHDDVVDASEMRRGKETANAIWGNEASVLVGDFLYSRAFQMMVDVNDMRIMQLLANATNVIAEGEVMQLLNCHEPETTEACYLAVIRCKTAKLFEAAGQIGALLCHQPPEVLAAMGRYGMHLGTAFQLIDDVLDYSASSEAIGKNIGDDLAEGKPTLPLIYTIQHGKPQHVQLIRQAIKLGQRDRIEEVIEAINATGAIDYTAQVAIKEAEMAMAELSVLPPSPSRDALYGLADFAVKRTY